MSDPRFVEAVRNVPHDNDCSLFSEPPRDDAGCDCDRDERMAAGLEAAVKRMQGPGTTAMRRGWIDKSLAAFTSASAPKEG